MFFNQKNFVALYAAFTDLIADQSPMPLDKFRRMQRKLARMIWDKATEQQRINLFENYIMAYAKELRETHNKDQN